MAFKYTPSPFMLPNPAMIKRKPTALSASFRTSATPKVKWAGTKFILLLWQEQIVRDLFGIVRENGKVSFYRRMSKSRRRTANPSLPPPLPSICSTAAREPSAEVYGAACDRNQASIVLLRRYGAVLP